MTVFLAHRLFFNFVFKKKIIYVYFEIHVLFNKKIVFNMSIIQRCERREEGEQQQQVEQYNMVHLWEAQERERDAYPRLITTDTQGLLRQVGLSSMRRLLP